jgi:hypothetical protein
VLFVTPAVTAIGDALTSARADGTIAVIGHAKLAAALGATREVVTVAPGQRAATKLATALADLSAVEDGSLAAVVGVGVGTDEAWATTLREWSRVVRDGGALVLVDRARAHEVSRRALCAGLSELEQRHAGRVVVTSGLVTHL